MDADQTLQNAGSNLGLHFLLTGNNNIGVGRFRILGGPRFRILGGGPRGGGANSQ